MVALDHTALFGQVRRLRLPLLAMTLAPLVASLGAVAVALVLGAILFRGFGENGFRLGSQLAWRYTSLVFFAALVAATGAAGWLRTRAQGSPLAAGASLLSRRVRNC
jgi:hypothetical protein